MSYFVTGTDTDVGKTIACSWLMLHNPQAHYWKPIQAGLIEQDLVTVQSLTELEKERFEPCRYLLKEALSPHEAALRENIEIKLDKITRPSSKQLIVEGAGGLLVPINDDFFIIDLIKKMNMPVVVVARTALGTINHTLLSLEVLRNRGIKVAGIILNGHEVSHNRKAIEYYGDTQIIGEIPCFNKITKEALLNIEPQCALNL